MTSEMERTMNNNTGSGEIERWLNVADIAEYVGCSKDTIRSWVKKGTIPFHKVGRQFKFKASEIDMWIESGESADADKERK